MECENRPSQLQPARIVRIITVRCERERHSAKKTYRRPRRLLRVGLFCIISAIGARSNAAPSSAGPLVDGVLARARALVSGRIDYHLSDAIPKRNKTIHDSDFRFSLLGDSWARRNAAAPGLEINHRGMHLLYVEANEGQTIRRSAAIYNPEAIDRLRPCPPYFAGTIWYRSTIEFIETHRDAVKTRTGAQSGTVATEIAEWAVDSKDGRAFGPAPPSLLKGGTLRLQVAPALGYALPLIECLAADGSPQMAYQSTNFFEAGPGLFLPRHCEARNVSHAGGYYVQYEITNAEMINEEVPEEDFQVFLPTGTNVSDSRTPGGATVFRVGEIPVLPNNLGEVIQLSPRDRAPWLRAALIGGCLGLAFVALLTVIRKARGRRGVV